MLFNLSVPDRFKNSASDPEFRVFTNAAADGPVELLVMDQIGEDFLGDGVSAERVVGFLDQHKGREVNVRINSPGGLVFDGMVIYNALANHGSKVTVTVEGLAFSAASFIAMAGDHIRMHEASNIGIHRAWSLAIGNARAMQDAMEWLDKLDSQLVTMYADRTGNSRKQIEEWMDGTMDGTLFTAAEAVDAGFADEMIPGKKKAKDKAEPAIKGVSSRVAAAAIRNYKARLLSRR